MRFVDECQIELKAGNGGDGIIAWLREAHNQYGGPSGGDGGKGGDIIICANENVQTLFELRHTKTIFAQNGGNGQRDCMAGKNGQDKIIQVPVGTSIYDEQNQLIDDLIVHKQSIIICRGGKQGYGNAKFKSAENRTPYIYERGDYGEKKLVHLRLRFLANVGIIGLPNAGKSTLINAVSKANSRIGDYAFTTLFPVLGAVELHGQKLLFADIPGLIEQASIGKGLGHDFLKHAERCQILIHLISMSPSDNEDVVKAYQIIQKELENYSSDLNKKKIMVVANKCDLDGTQENYAKLVKFLGKKIPFISAKNKDINTLLTLIFEQYNQVVDCIQTETNATKNYVVAPKNSEKLFDIKIEKTGDDDYTLWKIYHPRIMYWYHRIPLTTFDNTQRFKEKLKKLGLGDIIKKANINSEDQLMIGEHKFTAHEFY